MDCSNPECRKLQKEVERLRSTGYDMLKQTGRWQSFGATPEDLSKQFLEFFDHEVYNMTETLQESSQVDENVAREMLSTAVQESYDVCRAAILSHLMKTLERVVTVDVSTSRTSADDEELYDISRAYGLLLSASGLADSKSYRLKKVSEQVRDRISARVRECDGIQNFADEAANLSWNLLTMVPPLVSVQPETTLDKKWHEPERDSWTDEEKDYELVYYRPVLFRSSAGAVARKGVVGNRKQNTQSKHDTHPEDRHAGTGEKEPEVFETGEDILEPTSCPLQLPELPNNTHPRPESGMIEATDAADDRQYAADSADAEQCVEWPEQQNMDSTGCNTSENENIVESSDQHQQPSADIFVSLQIPTSITSASATDLETWEVLPPMYQGATHERASVDDNREMQPPAIEEQAVCGSRVSRDTTIGLIIGSILTPIGLLILLFLYLLYKFYTQKCFVPI